MSPIALYSYWRSSCSYRVRIALNLKEVSFEYREVHLVKEGGQQHGDAFRSLNPMGQVPFLIHEGKAISQSMAILEYLDQVFPDPALFPANPFKGAQVRQLCEMINAGIQPLQNLSLLQKIASDFNGDKGDWCRHWMAIGFQAFEKQLETVSGSYCMGDTLTAADCLLIPQIYNALRFGVDMTPYPNMVRINRACLALEAFQLAAPENQPDAPKD